MRTITLLLLILALGAIQCSESTGPEFHKWSLTVLSGDSQTTTAGADSLLDPVVGQLAALPSGQTAFILGAQPLDAQTTVGTPLPDQVVCAVGVGEHPLRAWNPCTNTDAAGQAKFWFQGGTLAGVDSAEIRGIQNDSPVVAAIVTATVAPGPVDSMYVTGIGLVRSSQPRTIPQGVQLAVDSYGNPIPSCPAFSAADSASVRTTNTDWPDCRSIYWQAAPDSGVYEVRDSTGAQIGHGWWWIENEILYLEARGMAQPCSNEAICG